MLPKAAFIQTCYTGGQSLLSVINIALICIIILIGLAIKEIDIKTMAMICVLMGILNALYKIYEVLINVLC